jgi:hypothetical protein
MIAFRNTSQVLFRLPACCFLLQGGHRPVKDMPHGVIPSDLHPQLPAAADHIGRKFKQQKTKPFQPCGLKRLRKPQTADAVEKIVGNQSGQKQRIVGPEAVGADRGGGKIVFKLLDHLLHHSAAVVESPDTFRIQMKVRHHHFVVALHQLKERQLRGLLLGGLVSFDHRHAPGPAPALDLTVNVGGKMPLADRPPVLDLRDLPGHGRSQFELGHIAGPKALYAVQDTPEVSPLSNRKTVSSTGWRLSATSFRINPSRPCAVPQGPGRR